LQDDDDDDIKRVEKNARFSEVWKERKIARTQKHLQANPYFSLIVSNKLAYFRLAEDRGRLSAGREKKEKFKGDVKGRQRKKKERSVS